MRSSICLGMLLLASHLTLSLYGQTQSRRQVDSLGGTVESLVRQTKRNGSIDQTKVEEQLKSNGIQATPQQINVLKKQIEVLAKTEITADVQKVLSGSQNVDQMLKGISDWQGRMKDIRIPDVKLADGSVLPDLIVETLIARAEEQDKQKFTVIAVLRNGVKDESVKRAAYPGGGKLIIHQMNETINLDRGLDFDFSKRGNVIGSAEIPRLRQGQAIRLTVAADGGAFTAITIPVTTDTNPSNNFKQLFKTAKISLTVTEEMMKEWIKPQEMQIHVNETGSYALINQEKYDLPRIPRKTIDLKVGNLVYFVNNINSSSITFDLKKSAIEWIVTFETNGPEIVGQANGAFGERLAPDVNADPIKLKVSMPFHFDEEKKVVKLGDPKVSLQAQWALNITFLSKDLRDSLLEDDWINQPVEAGITSAFKQHRSKIEKALAGEIQKALNGGSITQFISKDDTIQIEAQARLSTANGRK